MKRKAHVVGRIILLILGVLALVLTGVTGCGSDEEEKEDVVSAEDGFAMPKTDVQACEPACEGLECGDDGCGGVCGMCNDMQPCTVDSCVEGKCQNELDDIWCLIDGVCYSPNQPNPADPCQLCIPSKTPGAWTAADEGAECGPGSRCHNNQCCNAAKNCSQEAKECGDDGCGGICGDCDDGIECTEDTCEVADWTCASALMADYCLMNFVCYADGTLNPANPCQMCDSAETTEAWSLADEGSECADGMICFGGGCCDAKGNCEEKDCGDDGCGGSCGDCVEAQEECVDGLCTCIPACDGKECGPDGCDGVCGTGECDDGLDCTADECLGDGTCGVTISEFHCLIDLVCYAINAPDPADPCQFCDPGQAQNGWSSLPENADCGNGKTCVNGNCQ